jgi:hypothetical protein
MSWEKKILPVDALDFLSGVQDLIQQQRKTWPMLREAIAGLDEVKYKRLNVKGSEVFAQFNPKRIVSTGAKVDATTIGGRPCFLCLENLPAEEMCIPFGDNFVALCNPFPVLPNHLVISSRSHIPQTIEGNFATLLELAQSLGEGWFALYNGPSCGASAPDHLHFQACSSEKLPIMSDLALWQQIFWWDINPVYTFTLRGYRLNALFGRSREPGPLIEWFDKVIGALTEITNSDGEPMINIVVVYDHEELIVVCYPRSRHRPSCYDAEGDTRLTVSPAAIDLSGVMVTPHYDHYTRITAEDVEKIYAEVVLDNQRFKDLGDRLMSKYYG